MWVQHRGLNTEILEDLRFVERDVQARSRSFTRALGTLPNEKRYALFAVYLWMQRVDDIADDAAPSDSKKSKLESFRQATQSALCGDRAVDPLLRSIQWVRGKFEVPDAWYAEVFQGMDLDIRGFEPESWDELERYCDLVAGIPGKFCLKIFGVSSPLAWEQGKHLARALQLTNILRDLHTDAVSDRIYLPRSLRRQAALSLDDLKARRYSPSVDLAVNELIKRVEVEFQASQQIHSFVEKDSQQAMTLIRGVYRALFEMIKQSPNLVFEPNLRLSSWTKTKLYLFSSLRWLR